MTKKLPAFTLYEMLFVLILSSLVISMAYFAMNWIRKEFRNYSTKQSYVQEKLFLKQQLDKDVEQCHWLYANNEKLSLFNDTDTVQYLATDSTLIRRYKNRSLNFNFSKVQFSNHRLLDNNIRYCQSVYVTLPKTYTTDSILLVKELDAFASFIRFQKEKHGH